AADDEFFDLVLEAADARLLELLAAKLLRLLDADAADAGDGLTAGVESQRLEAPLCLGRGGHGARDIVKDAPRPRLAVRAAIARGGLSGAHTRQHLLDHVADQLVGDLHRYCS